MRGFLWSMVVVAVVASAWLAGCGRAASTKPTAVATIFCYYDALRAIGGDKINAVLLLPPNTSPHEYQASLKDRTTVDGAQLVVKNGLGIDDWVDGLASTSAARVVTIGKDAEVLQTEEVAWGEAPATGTSQPASRPAEAAKEEHGMGNPHIWLDPHVQIKAAERIRDALIALDPADRAVFEANATKYIEAIRQLDADFAAAAATFKHKDFIGFHSAYDYLAHRYGLRQVAAIEEVPEAGLVKAQIDRVIALIQEKHVPVVFTEDAFPAQAAESIIAQTHVKRGILQPLETYTSLDDTYVSLMRQNLAELKRTLGE